VPERALDVRGVRGAAERKGELRGGRALLDRDQPALPRGVRGAVHRPVEVQGVGAIGAGHGHGVLEARVARALVSAPLAPDVELEPPRAVIHPAHGLEALRPLRLPRLHGPHRVRGQGHGRAGYRGDDLHAQPAQAIAVLVGEVDVAQDLARDGEAGAIQRVPGDPDPLGRPAGGRVIHHPRLLGAVVDEGGPQELRREHHPRGHYPRGHHRSRVHGRRVRGVEGHAQRLQAPERLGEEGVGAVAGLEGGHVGAHEVLHRDRVEGEIGPRGRGVAAGAQDHERGEGEDPDAGKAGHGSTILRRTAGTAAGPYRRRAPSEPPRVGRRAASAQSCVVAALHGRPRGAAQPLEATIRLR
jgi:hypothetical protein